MSVEMKRGWWEDNENARWFIVGSSQDGTMWIAHDGISRMKRTDRDGVFIDCFDGRSRLTKELPDCTGWDWQPPTVKKSLGELLLQEIYKEKICYQSNVRESLEAAAQAFLRAVVSQGIAHNTLGELLWQSCKDSKNGLRGINGPKEMSEYSADDRTYVERVAKCFLTAIFGIDL